MRGHGYLRRMLDMLTGAYNRSDMQTADKGEPPRTNIGRLFATLAWGFELIHDSADTMRLWNDIDKATGATLDCYGANFGVARQDTDDAFYRLLIRVKVMTQISGGDVDTVVNAIAALFGIAPEELDFGEVYPAKVRVLIDNAYLDADRVRLAPVIIGLIKRILPAGVGIEATIISRSTACASMVIGASAASYEHARAIPPPPAPASVPVGIGAALAEYQHANSQAYEQTQNREEAEA